MLLRLCLKDKSSVLVESSMVEIERQAREGQFIKVINHKTQKSEMYNKDWIWCIRISSQGEKEN